MSEIKVTVSRPYRDMWVVQGSRNGRQVVYREATSAAEAKRIAKKLNEKG